MTQDVAPRPRSDLDDLARLGQWLAWAESGKQDERSRGAAAALRLYYARELGLTAMAASELSVIGGKLVVGAGLIRALARRAGYRVYRLYDDNGSTCTARIALAATGEVLGESTFTLDEAKKAGLIRERSAWITHPGRMLWARASKNVVVDFAPEVALGMLLDDEVQELAAPAASDIPWIPDDDEDEALEDEAQDEDAAGEGVDVDDIEF
jgi:hypothetical protein